MGALADMSPWIDAAELQRQFDPRAVIRMPATRGRPAARANWCSSAIGSAIIWRWSTTASSCRRRRRRPTSWSQLRQGQHGRRGRRRRARSLRAGVELHRAVLRHPVSHRVRRLGVRRASRRAAGGAGSDARYAGDGRGVRVRRSRCAASTGAAAIGGLRNRGVAVSRRQGGDAHRRRLELAEATCRRRGSTRRVAVLPVVSATGLPMAPMVSPKGYSLTRVRPGRGGATTRWRSFEFLTDEETQRDISDASSGFCRRGWRCATIRW